MANHIDADKASLITVKTVLDLAKRGKEIYGSSKVDEKRQILHCQIISNFGGGGIRTHDTRLTYTRFPGVLHRPLGHSSLN
jgi:hypothetical protein